MLALALLTGCGAATQTRDDVGGYDESQFQGLLGAREGLSAEGVRVLMFTKTAGFRHGSIPTSKEVMTALAEAHGFSVDVTEDAEVFSEEGLEDYDVVMFASTTGEVLNTAQGRALEDFVTSGGGFVGVHAASDTLYEWPWYGGLVGAYFSGHPFGTSVATLHNEDPGHPSTDHLGSSFQMKDEWYFFDRNPRGEVRVLLTLDEGSNDALANYPQAAPDGDHPITWCRPYEGGRSWYTALGHRNEVWRDVRFQEMLLGGVAWAAGGEGGCEIDGPGEGG